MNDVKIINYNYYTYNSKSSLECVYILTPTEGSFHRIFCLDIYGYELQSIIVRNRGKTLVDVNISKSPDIPPWGQLFSISHFYGKDAPLLF